MRHVHHQAGRQSSWHWRVKVAVSQEGWGVEWKIPATDQSQGDQDGQVAGGALRVENVEISSFSKPRRIASSLFWQTIVFHHPRVAVERETNLPPSGSTTENQLSYLICQLPNCGRRTPSSLASEWVLESRHHSATCRHRHIQHIFLAARANKRIGHRPRCRAAPPSSP